MNWNLKYLPEAEKRFKRPGWQSADLVLKAIKKVLQNPLPVDENDYGNLLEITAEPIFPTF